METPIEKRSELENKCSIHTDLHIKTELQEEESEFVKATFYKIYLNDKVNVEIDEVKIEYEYPEDQIGQDPLDVNSEIAVERSVEEHSKNLLEDEKSNEVELNKKEHLLQIDDGSRSSTRKQLFVKNEPVCITKNHKCSTCKKSFTKIDHLNRHLRIHKDEKSLECSVCKISFTRKDRFTKHMNVHSKKKYVCDKCKKEFNDQSNLDAHKLIYNGMKISCDEYNEIESNEKQGEGEPSTQNQLIEKNEPVGIKKTFNCHVCHKSFPRKYNLDNHLRIHTGEKPFTCSICNTSFTENSTLLKHILIHSDKKPYVCGICKKGFNQKSQFDQHKLIHIGVTFPCDECNKIFLYKQQLDIHKRIHTGERPYSCNICDKAFTQKNSLTVHKRLHTGEKPYTCSVCNKSYAQLSGFNQHKQKYKH